MRRSLQRSVRNLHSIYSVALCIGAFLIRVVYCLTLVPSTKSVALLFPKQADTVVAGLFSEASTYIPRYRRGSTETRNDRQIYCKFRDVHRRGGGGRNDVGVHKDVRFNSLPDRESDKSRRTEEAGNVARGKLRLTETRRYDSPYVIAPPENARGREGKCYGDSCHRGWFDARWIMLIGDTYRFLVRVCIGKKKKHWAETSSSMYACRRRCLLIARIVDSNEAKKRGYSADSAPDATILHRCRGSGTHRLRINRGQRASWRNARRDDSLKITFKGILGKRSIRIYIYTHSSKWNK